MTLLDTFVAVASDLFVLKGIGVAEQRHTDKLERTQCKNLQSSWLQLHHLCMIIRGLANERRSLLLIYIP